MGPLKLISERKRALLTPAKWKKLDRCATDRISMLPDELLGSILSRLNFKEAVGSSALSKRWMHLWKFFARTMNFEASELLCGIDGSREILQRERSKYVTRLNKGIESYQGYSIDEFSVWFDLDESSTSDIDRWIQFAISKRVQRLKVKLQRINCNQDDSYTLRASCLEIPKLAFNMKFLTEICFSYVNLTGELLECFLCNCPHLERLSVTMSRYLVSLVVPSSAIQLKCLEIFSCFWLKHVEINAPNLVTLKYYGCKEAMHFGNMSKLVDLTLGGGRYEHSMDKFCMFSSYHLQLKFLKLGISGMDKVNVEHIRRLRLPNLKHLTMLMYDKCSDERLLGWLTLLKASPSLQKCTLEFEDEYVERKLNGPKLSHKGLKVVEVVGFNGTRGQLTLVTFLIESFIKLEKVVIDRRYRLSYISTPVWRFKEIKKTQDAKEVAMQLRKKLRPGAKLVVI